MATVLTNSHMPASGINLVWLLVAVIIDLRGLGGGARRPATNSEPHLAWRDITSGSRHSARSLPILSGKGVAVRVPFVYL